VAVVSLLGSEEIWASLGIGIMVFKEYVTASRLAANDFRTATVHLSNNRCMPNLLCHGWPAITRKTEEQVAIGIQRRKAPSAGNLCSKPTTEVGDWVGGRVLSDEGELLIPSSPVPHRPAALQRRSQRPHRRPTFIDKANSGRACKHAEESEWNDNGACAVARVAQELGPRFTFKQPSDRTC
jgi:hypothetical protein